MALVAVTTVRRWVAPHECSGRLLLVELDPGGGASVLHEAILPESSHRHRDTNPRGGTRGVRAVAVHDERLFAVTYAELHRLDDSFRTEASWGHPMMAQVHDLLSAPDGLWIVATKADALLLMAPGGELRPAWRPAQSETLRREFGLARTSEAPRDYREPVWEPDHGATHMNAVLRGRDELLVSLGRVTSPGARAASGTRIGLPDDPAAVHAIVSVPLEAALGRATNDDASTLMVNPAPRLPNHNLYARGARIAFNDANRGALIVHDVAAGKTVGSIQLPGTFPRGMCELDDGRLLIGNQQPLSLHLVDIGAARLVRSWPLPGPDNESITAIVPLPATCAG
jgi:hypothetical protein